MTGNDESRSSDASSNYHDLVNSSESGDDYDSDDSMNSYLNDTAPTMVDQTTDDNLVHSIFGITNPNIEPTDTTTESTDITMEEAPNDTTPAEDLEEDEALERERQHERTAEIAFQIKRKTRLDNANASLAKSFIYNYHDDKFKATPLGQKFKNQSRLWNASPPPTHFDALSSKPKGNDFKSVHDIIVTRLPTLFKTFHNKKWKTGTKADFVALATACLTEKEPWTNTPRGQQLRHTFIALARMSPEILTYHYSVGKLVDSPEPLIWLAANTVLGSHWKITIMPPKAQKLSFAAVTAAGSPPPAGTFLHARGGASSSDTHDWETAVTKLSPRAHHTFFTLILPELLSEGAELIEEALHCLHEALSSFWSADSKFTLYVFPTKLKLFPRFKPLSTLPSEGKEFTRSLMEKYAHNIYVRQGKRPYIRFYAGHDAPISIFEDPNLLQQLDDRDIKIELDEIQAPVTVTVGWLLGTHRSLNMQHYGALMQANEKFADHPVSLVSRAIKMSFDEKTNRQTEIRATHILCDASKRSSTDLKLKAQYNRLRDTDLATLPEGKFLKYIPFSGNRGDRIPPAAKLRELRLCRIKQSQFLEHHSTSPIMGVIDLDYPQDFKGNVGTVTLRQIILGIKTKSNWLWALFLSVDHDTYRGDITALYHQDNSTEAINFLSYLPIFLEAQYGSKIWNWFSVECRSELSSIQLDPNSGAIIEVALAEDGGLLDNLYGEDELAAWERVQDQDIDDQEEALTFDLGNHFNLVSRAGGAGFDDGLSLGSMKTGTSNATQAAKAMQLDPILGDLNPTKDGSVSELSHAAVSSIASAPPQLSSFPSSQPSRSTAPSGAPSALRGASVPQTGVASDNG